MAQIPTDTLNFGDFGRFSRSSGDARDAQTPISGTHDSQIDQPNDAATAARALIASLEDNHTAAAHAHFGRQDYLATPEGHPTLESHAQAQISHFNAGPVSALQNPLANIMPLTMPTSQPVRMPATDISASTLALPFTNDQPFELSAPAVLPKRKHRNQSEPERKSRIPSRIRPVLIALSAFALIFLLFKAPVLFSQISYNVSPSSNNSAVITPAAEAVPTNPTITIPKINVSAPVIFEQSFEEAKIQKALEGGVVHYGNTPVPGMPGNSVIVGHSSNDWWEPGNYKFVFVLLDKLIAGDRFSVNYNGKKYIYEVTIVKVVEPTDLSVLTPTAEPTMTIITCTPPGTSWKRLVVQAKQVSPDVASDGGLTVTPVADQSAGSSLPGSAPSLTDQIVGFFRHLFGQDDTSSSTSTTGTTANPPTTAPNNNAKTLPAIK